MTRFGVTLAVMLCFARVHAQIPEMPQSDFEAMVEELSNWGRWGREDQIGALNLITPEKRLQAAKLVKEGISIRSRTPQPPKSLPTIRTLTSTRCCVTVGVRECGQWMS